MTVLFLQGESVCEVLFARVKSLSFIGADECVQCILFITEEAFINISIKGRWTLLFMCGSSRDRLAIIRPLLPQ